MTDVGSRFAVGKFIERGTWEELQDALNELWIPYFGRPKTLRVDPAGAFLKGEADLYLAERDIFFGEAHWRLGIVEHNVKSIKGMLDSLAEEFTEATDKQLLAQCLWVINCRTIYRGYSPMQYVLGKTPDDCWRVDKQDREFPIHPDLILDNGFQQDEKIRKEAEKAFVEEQCKGRVERAERMGNRAYKTFNPGDLVYYWCRQLPKSEKSHFRTGKFLGPARVLATETRNEEGVLRPGGTIWIFRGGKLMRATPEQLRLATTAETMLEELQQPVELPWTITSLCDSAKKSIYTDITEETPSLEEWQQAHDPEEPELEGPPAPIRRHSEKKPLEPENTKRGKFPAQQTSA